MRVPNAAAGNGSGLVGGDTAIGNPAGIQDRGLVERDMAGDGKVNETGDEGGKLAEPLRDAGGAVERTEPHADRALTALDTPTLLATLPYEFEATLLW